jgi:malonyl-CoA O-methyltransferase
MPEPIKLDARTGYDRWAQVYDTEDNPLVRLEGPVVREWIRDPAGRRIADVACGTGRHTLWLAEAGAVVHAYDASAGMIEKAREKLANHDVRLAEHALPNALPVEDDFFDGVLFALVADHIADLTGAYRELHRVLKPGGWLVSTVLHPAMNLLGLTARFWDPVTGEEVRVDAFEHTYADYVMAPLKARFRIEEIAERKADAELAKVAPRAEKYIDWPMLLAMRLQKPT